MVYLIEKRNHNTLVIRQKGEPQNGGNKKTKNKKKEHLLHFDTHTYMYIYTHTYAYLHLH